MIEDHIRVLSRFNDSDANQYSIEMNIDPKKKRIKLKEKGQSYK